MYFTSACPRAIDKREKASYDPIEVQKDKKKAFSIQNECNKVGSLKLLQESNCSDLLRILIKCS